MGHRHSQQPSKHSITTRAVESLEYDESLTLEEYSLLKELGEGSYGRVRMVRLTLTQDLYALKYVDKRHTAVVLKTIVDERNILANLRHPFICNLNYAFQDDGFYCLVLDLGDAGDLRKHLSKYSFSEESVRHWIAELACAVDYLHGNSIVHRDIKPENILMDSEGHVKLADFNVARRLTYDQPTIKGVSGTFNYLAPEMHQGVPYTEKVDWWALGVVFFECIYNQVPFRVKVRSNMLAVMTSPGLRFPATTPSVSESCKNAIVKLLQVYPPDRVSSAQQLFKSKFFGGLDAGKLEAASFVIQSRTHIALKSDYLPLYKPVLRHVSRNSPQNDIRYQRETLVAEYGAWVKKKAAEDLEKLKKRKLAAAAAAALKQQQQQQESPQDALEKSKKEPLFKEESNPQKSNSVGGPYVNISSKNPHQDRQPSARPEKGKDIKGCFSFPKFYIFSTNASTRKNKKKSSGLFGRRKSSENGKPREINHGSTLGNTIRRRVNLKIKHDLERSFVPFDCHSQRKVCQAGEGTTLSTYSGSLTTVRTGNLSDFNKDPNGGDHSRRAISYKTSHSGELKKHTQDEGGSTTSGSCTHKETLAFPWPKQYEEFEKGVASGRSSVDSGNRLKNKKLMSLEKSASRLPVGVLSKGPNGRVRIDVKKKKELLK